MAGRHVDPPSALRTRIVCAMTGVGVRGCRAGESTVRRKNLGGRQRDSAAKKTAVSVTDDNSPGRAAGL